MKENIKNSILSQSQKKIALIIFEVILFIFALFFLTPAFLTILNSFKSTPEIQMSVLTLPKLSKKIPVKIKNDTYVSNILNFLNKEDRVILENFYNPEGNHYYLKKDISIEDKKKLAVIFAKTNIFRTVWENTINNYRGAWFFGNKPVEINGKKRYNFVTFPRVFLNTLIVTVFSVLGIIISSSMAAYALVRTKNKISWIIFLIFTFSMVVPFQAIMIPLVETAKVMGLKNSLFGLILIYIGLGSPLAIFMYHGFIKGIPIELEESASIDGAGQFRIFFQIIFPLLKPITATIVILNVLWIWNDFLLPLIILQAENIKTIQLKQYSFFGAFHSEYGMALASLIISASPIVIFYLLMQKYIIKGITSGAVKG